MNAAPSNVTRFTGFAAVFAILVTVFCRPCRIVAATDAELEEQLLELLSLSLEELTQIEVTSVSKKSERLFDALAAIYVITAEDSQRSGFRRIPEMLRLAPGVQVGRAGDNGWGVSIRGFNDVFSNKLLVLMDGRSLYTPLFSGVFWDVQEIPRAVYAMLTLTF